MKRIAICMAAGLLTSTAAIANDRYYDAPYSGPYVGDGYAEWHPEFRSREARYRHDNGYYEDRAYRPARRRHHRKRYRGSDYEEEFYVGNCKVERECEIDGSY